MRSDREGINRGYAQVNIICAYVLADAHQFIDQDWTAIIIEQLFSEGYMCKIFKC